MCIRDRSDTAVGVANRWIPIRPGTDMALVAGMIRYLFSAGKLDEQLIRDKFVGFFSDSFADDVKAAEPTSTAFMGLDKSGALTIDEDMSYELSLIHIFFGWRLVFRWLLGRQRCCADTERPGARS